MFFFAINGMLEDMERAYQTEKEKIKDRRFIRSIAEDVEFEDIIIEPNNDRYELVKKVVE